MIICFDYKVTPVLTLIVCLDSILIILKQIWRENIIGKALRSRVYGLIKQTEQEK